jgi:hypothetical protein
MYRHHFVEAERSPGQVCRSVYLEDPAIFILIYAKWQLVLVKIFCDCGTMYTQTPGDFGPV